MTSIIPTLSTISPDFASKWEAYKQKFSLAGALMGHQARQQAVRDIIEQVRSGGDVTLCGFSEKFDGVKLTPSELRISNDELAAAHAAMPGELLAALRRAIANVREYQERIKINAPQDWKNTNGSTLGVRYNPLRRVGICVPGASAPLPSTVIMTVVPALVAGVQETAVISAPRFQGSIHPVILAVCHELGVTDVYRVSGAHAVAALAWGTHTIKKVDKIVGPGNIWGQLAKKEVFGLVDIDSFAGPSDVLVLADDSANPAYIAADLLSQAEHAPGSSMLITDSTQLAAAVQAQLSDQLEKLSRVEATRKCVTEDSLIVVAENIGRCVELANDFAAEHLQIQCRDSQAVATQIVNAGAIFIGHYTPVACGDYYAGPSHTLPTGGSAKIFGPLNVNDFLRQSSIISYDKPSLGDAAGDIGTIAAIEGLDAHAQSVTVRL